MTTSPINGESEGLPASGESLAGSVLVNVPWHLPGTGARPNDRGQLTAALS